MLLERDPGLSAIRRRAEGPSAATALDAAARSALHLDVSAPDTPSAEDAPSWGGQFVGGPYGVRAADPEGNLVDLIPAGPCWEDPAVSAWRGGFAAQAAWRAGTARDAARFAEEVAAAVDAAAMALAIDRRGDLVVLDSGKDTWETEAGFVDLAAEVQRLAEQAHLVEVPDGLGFVQAFLTVPDVASSRTFWASVLGYREDPREGVLDLIDPDRLGPVLGFQTDDAPPERGSRDPFHLHLALPEAAAAELLERGAPGLDTVRETGERSWELVGPEGTVLEILGLPAVGPA